LREQRQKLVSDLDYRLGKLLPAELSYRAEKLFKFVWRSELAERQTDVTAAIAFLNISRRPAYNAIYELERLGLVARITDENLRRRKLLCVTKYGWNVLAAVTAKYSNIVVEHVRQLHLLETDWVELEETSLIGRNKCLPIVKTFCQWSSQRSSEPIPTRFLDRVFILDVANAEPGAFTVDFWGRGIQLRDGHNFAGHQFADLQKCSSISYWQQAADAFVEALSGDGRPTTNEVRLNFGGQKRTVQRTVIPDLTNRRIIVGTWWVEPQAAPVAAR